MASFQGNLENIDLASVFQNLLNNSQTGTLIVTPGTAMPLRTSDTDACERHVFFERGSMRLVSSAPGEPVGANTPSSLPPFPEGQPKNRLGLARRIGRHFRAGEELDEAFAGSLAHGASRAD